MIASIRLEIETFILSSDKVANDSLDCHCMTVLWIGSESCNLTDTKSYIGAVFVGKIEKPLSHTGIVPVTLIIVKLSIRIRVESCLSSGSLVWIAVFKASGFDNLFDKT